MRRYFLIAAISALSVVSYAQSSQPVFVNMSGRGETTYAPAGGFSFSHHTNYTMTVRSVTAKWDLRTLLGQPVVVGVFKWEAGEGTPEDYLDYKDCVLLECSPRKGVGYMVYIKLSPTVPVAGKGYGFNTPGSPSWEDVFCTIKGEPMTTRVPAFNGKTAREIWKNGFYVTGVVLIRDHGDEGYLMAQTEKNRSKYNALSNPFTLTVKNNDTVFTDRIRPLTGLNDYFKNDMVFIDLINKEADFGYVAQSANDDLVLAKGWNNIHYRIRSKGFSVSDSLRVYYPGSSRKVLLSDDFNDGIADGRIFNAGYSSEYVGIYETNGCLFVKQGGEHTAVRATTRDLTVDPAKKVVLEFTCTMVRTSACYDAWVNIKGHSIICQKNCDAPEAVKMIWDMQAGTIDCYINNELFSHKENPYLRQSGETVRFEFSCTDFQKFMIDDLVIYQE